MKSKFARLLLTLTVAFPLIGGVHYTARTITESPDSETIDMKVEAWIDGENAKILFLESSNPVMAEGSYILTQDGGKTLYIVNPDDKTYSELSLENMLGAMGGMVETVKGMINMEFSDPEVTKLEEKDGGPVLGRKTTYYKYKTKYAISMKMLGMKRYQENESIQEIWSTTAFDDVALGVWMRSAPPRTGDEGLDKLIQAEMDKVQGFPLKTKTTTTTRDYNKKRTKVKKERVTQATTDVLTLEEQQSGSDLYQVPEGYEKVNMFGVSDEEGDGNPLKGLFKKN